MIEETLKFTLTWAPSEVRPRRLTACALTVWFGDHVIWPVEQASHVSADIQADDLLSYLSEFWKPLLLRQTYPIGARPERPSLLRSEAERRWSSYPSEVAEREDDIVSAFEEAHDLSRCFAGQFGLPPLWLLREGDRMLVETSRALRSLAFAQVRDALTSVGNEIAARLTSSKDERWSDLVEAWNARDQGDPSVILAWSAGLDRDTAASFLSDGVLSAPTSVAEASKDTDELRIAARMSGALPAEHIRKIIDYVAAFEKTAAPKLDAIGLVVSEHIRQHFGGHRPYEQGEAAAHVLREHLGYASVHRIDIFKLIDDFGAALHHESVEPTTLFALAVWGQRHGPAILLNQSRRLGNKDIRRDAAARVTLAHELCHLLLDRGHALSAVEILDSRMPLDIERRAKAFAAEFLLPGRIAADLWFRAKNPRSPKGLGAFLRTLVRRYGVTPSVAAWKLEHGLHRHDIDLRVVLDALVPGR